MAVSRPALPAVLALAVVGLGILPARGTRAYDQPGLQASPQIPDSTAVASTVSAFHRALQSGDAAAIRDLLADDVRVAEGGGIETRAEYLEHHLPGDMSYAAAVTREPGPIHVTVQGDVAWTVSTSRASGSLRGRSINSILAELMVLSRSDGGWRIRAVHWSSRQAR